MLLDRHVAIVGAGGAGACTALELALRGYRVDLFEREPEAVSQATFACEGKVHLGLIYAKDRSLRTAHQMLAGALEFADRLKRWVPFEAKDSLSTPFLYGVHRGSLMNPDELEVHYRRCEKRYDQLASESGLDYLGLGSGCRTRRMSESEYPDELDPDFFEALFETTEFALDPREFAESLRTGLDEAPGIHVRPEHTVTGVAPSKGSGFDVHFEVDGRSETESYSDVINASWHRRLPIDRPFGIEPHSPWSHRYKFGHRLAIPLQPDQLPSITCVQGPFGDIVNFRDHGAFLSWYPTGRTGMSTEESPPDWHREYSPADRMEVFDRSFEQWLLRCPALQTLPLEPDRIDPYGGVIYALGTTDVDDETSRLHERFEVGIQSAGRYHSLDPGKFTLIPYWAMRMADRIDKS